MGLVELNRPKVLNALCNGLMKEVINALNQFDNDPNVGSVVITGNEKSFAAGADIKEMQDATYSKWIAGPLFDPLSEVASIRKPLIAAVNGFAVSINMFIFCNRETRATRFCCITLFFQDE